MEKSLATFIKNISDLVKLIISTSGLILKPLNFLSTSLIGISFIFSYVLAEYYSTNHHIAFLYYIIFEILYIGFIYAVLPQNGLRLWLIKKFKSEEKAYFFYQCVLGFLFFNNGLSMSYFSTSTKSDILAFVPYELLIVIVGILFVTGFVVKIWSAKVVGIDIYYWKDMFLGRKICEFVCCGPYRFISNPMYGIGQLQGYAIAILNGSIPGLIVVFINQCLVFSFYFTMEKKFIKAVYLDYQNAQQFNLETESEY
jgi:protein-S-isoprenylcysteine O-methyltransferase Ste14